MHLLYLDDSGSPGNPNEDYFVLGGVSIPETSVRWLCHEIDDLAGNFDPNAPESLEFHAAETFRGVIPPWSNLDRGQRRDAIRSVLHCLDQAYQNIVIFACAFHIKSFPNDDPVVSAYEDVASRFNIYLQRLSTATGTDQRGLVIVDNSSYEAGLQSLARKIRRTGNRWGNYNSSIVEVPLFVDSKASRIVQLADHIAYAVFRRYNASDLTYFDVIQDRFDQRDGVICGLAHKQKVIRNCTCPACITRK